MVRSKSTSTLWTLTIALAFTVACGDDRKAAQRTAAEVARVRGSVQVGEDAVDRTARILEGGRVDTAADGRARIRFDEGASALLDGTSRLAVADADNAELSAGRIFLDVPPGPPFTLRAGRSELRVTDAQVSVESHGERLIVDVLRGELSYRSGSSRGVADSGMRVSLGATATVEPRPVWQDWTSGLASPGPRDPREAAGIGVLEGRRPGDTGEARWPLVVRSLEVNVRVEGDLAITDVEQTFFNPASTTLEGLYRIRVPEDAVLQRFAVDRDGRMVDGYVREKRVAAAAYQAQVYEGSTLDPALLEWDSAGVYRARIHPIAAGESRTIAIRFSSFLERRADAGTRTYRFPMAGGANAPEIEALSVDVALEETHFEGVRASHGARLEGQHVRLRRSDFRPRADLVVELLGAEDSALAYRADPTQPLRDPNAPAPSGEESDYFFVPLAIPTPSAVTDGPMDLVIVADLSAGTDRGLLELGRTAVEALAANLRANDRVAIVGGDLSLRPLAGELALGPATPERVREGLDALSRAAAGGGSDLGAVLAEAAGLLDPTRNGAVIYVGDGAPTVGELGGGPLLERLARLPNPVRIFGVAVGDSANADLLDAVARPGGGRVVRVTSRGEAADAALDLVACVAHPVLERVTVDLGTGIDRIYPREAVSVEVGRSLSIVGRVRGALPASAKVTGFFAGRRFERRVLLQVEELDRGDDLRLRWASARLERLLLDGARRAEVVDLGVRAGVITPFTSLYVPSAAELAAMGSRADGLVRVASAPSSILRDVGGAPLIGFGLFPSLAGCSSQSREAAPSPALEREVAEAVAAQTARDEELSAAQSRGANVDEIARLRDQLAEARAAAPPSPSPSPSRANEAGEDHAMYAADDGDRGESGRFARTAAPASEPASAERGPLAGLGAAGMGSGGGGYGSVARRPVRSRAAARPEPEERPDDGSTTRRVADAVGADPSPPVLVRVAATAMVTPPDPRHLRTRCSEASGLALDVRVALFEERLRQADDAISWMASYERAVASCEAPTARDRRRLLEAVLDRAENVPAMVQAYGASSSLAARALMRRAILRRVRTPDDLRAVRAAFGTAVVDTALMEAELGRATDDAGRIVALRRLRSRFAGDLDLGLRLLGLYERVGRRNDALALALELRAHPLSDSGVRTAIGEFYLRVGDEREARRAFSEIVEFAPGDELARRRLGDLYRAHGWFEDAYRQYQTLAGIRPDDSTVLLLLAHAAAGAGRVDEALRLEQRLTETAPPGGSSGVARAALLWSSVRLAELRAAARGRNDATALRTYRDAMRRGGVLREASPLRAALVWSHPDADLALYAAHPGLGLSRPTDLAPELGIEAFDVREREGGTYRLEVRRGNRDGLPAVEAKLVVLFREGAADEQIVILPVRFAAGEGRAAFAIEGDEVRALARDGGAR